MDVDIPVGILYHKKNRSIAPVFCYYKVSFNHLKNSRCHTSAFCGLVTQ